MILQVGLFGESAGTDVALEGPRAAVHVHVRLEITGRWERLGAKAALVGLLLWVVVQMQEERQKIRKENLCST